MNAYIEAIATAVPDHEGHQTFLNFVRHRLPTEREQKLYSHLAKKSLIEKRYSVLAPSFSDEVTLEPSENRHLDSSGLYPLKGRFGSTHQRMSIYRQEAFPLAQKAIETLAAKHDLKSVTHIVVASCTGFYAPGIEFQIISHFGLKPNVERISIGFMGCFAGITTHRAARDIVLAHPEARVLVINIELCSLHFQESTEIENLLGYLQFADGCSATLVSSRPGPIRLGRSISHIWSDKSEQIQWHVTDQGFEMFLDLNTPKSLKEGLSQLELFDESYDLYAVHPGGRGILEAVTEGLNISKEKLESSYNVLKNFGNMSSATIQFVLKDMLEKEPTVRAETSKFAQKGIAMAFGPGLSVEALEFERNYL